MGKLVVKQFVDSLRPKDPVLLLVLTVCYFMGARMGVKLALVQPIATPIWLPAGGAIVAFILFGYRVWPAVFLGSLLGHLSVLGPVATCLLVPIGAVAEGLFGAYLVNEFAHGMKAFDTAKDVFLFVVFACVCAPVLNAVPAVAINYFGGHMGITESVVPVLQWWLAHGIGALLIGPFFILLFRTSPHRTSLRECVELTVLLVGLLTVCLLVFGPLSRTLNGNQIIRAWLCVPFLLWAAFRFCPLEVAGTNMILFGTAIWGTLHGFGTFVSKDVTISLVLLDTFVGVIGTMTLIVAAMVVERRKFEEELLGMHSLLQAEMEGKGRELAETTHALELELAVHSQTKRSLRANQERLEVLAGAQDRSSERAAHKPGKELS